MNECVLLDMTHLTNRGKKKTTVGDQMKAQLEKQTNTKHDEVNLLMKAHAYIHRLVELI